MFAIVKIGSTQYKISGDFIQVGVLKRKREKHCPDKVLLLADGDTVKIGQPYLTDVKITAQVVKHTLGEKVLAFNTAAGKNQNARSVTVRNTPL